MKTLVLTIRVISTCSPVIPLVLYFWKFSQHSRAMHWLGLYLLTCFAADILTFFRLAPSEVVFNLQDILQFLIMVLFYYEVLFKDHYPFPFIGGVMLYMFGAFLTHHYTTISQYNHLLWTLSSLILAYYGIIYSNLFLLQRVTEPQVDHRYNNLVANASFTFYFLATFMIFLFADYIFASVTDDIADAIWALHNGLNILKNLGLAAALLNSAKIFERLN